MLSGYMSGHKNNGTTVTAAQLRAAAGILEQAVQNRALLGELSEADRARLLRACHGLSAQ